MGVDDQKPRDVGLSVNFFVAYSMFFRIQVKNSNKHFVLLPNTDLHYKEHHVQGYVCNGKVTLLPKSKLLFFFCVFS